MVNGSEIDELLSLKLMCQVFQLSRKDRKIIRYLIIFLIKICSAVYLNRFGLKLLSLKRDFTPKYLNRI